MPVGVWPTALSSRSASPYTLTHDKQKIKKRRRKMQNDLNFIIQLHLNRGSLKAQLLHKSISIIIALAFCGKQVNNKLWLHGTAIQCEVVRFWKASRELLGTEKVQQIHNCMKIAAFITYNFNWIERNDDHSYGIIAASQQSKRVCIRGRSWCWCIGVVRRYGRGRISRRDHYDGKNIGC